MHIIFGRSEVAPSGSLRENEIVGAVANAIASNVGKLAPQVVRKDARGTTLKNDRLSRLLNIRPCPEASTYDFLYKMGSDLVYTSNAFAVLFYNDDFTQLLRIQPITVRTHKIFEDEDENVFFRFKWDYDGVEYTIPYQFVIHIKARYNKKRFLGTPPENDLQNSTELLDTTYNGIKNVIKNSASLRGYLKYNNFIDDDELKEKVKEFKEAYMSAENEGGIAGLDNELDFKEITQQPRQIPITQVTFFRENIYRYYGVNEKILNSTYSETEWNSFYEAVIEPIAIQLSLEFTFKVFTERERGFGNKVVFVTNRLQYATLQTRSTIGKDLFDRGIMTINEYRELMYMPQIEDGDVRMISLNYVKVDDQSLYQTGREGDDEGGNDPPEDDPTARMTTSYIKTKLRRG
jgi:HK97 family phage portal protein